MKKVMSGLINVSKWTRNLLNPSRFGGAVFASLVAAGIVALVQIYWANGLAFAEISIESTKLDRESLHSTLAGRFLFLIIQIISWIIVCWPVYRLFLIIDDGNGLGFFFDNCVFFYISYQLSVFEGYRLVNVQ